MRQKILLPLLGLSFWMSCKETKTVPPSGDDIIPVRTMVVHRDSMNSLYQVSGRFSTEDESVMAFKNGGTIRTIYVREGDHIKKGQLLAALDKTEIGTLVKQSEIGLSKAERDFNRASNLYKDSVATFEQMQNAKTALDIARQQVINAQYNLNTAEMRATRSGYVLRKYAQEGQIVGPGTPVLLINGASDGQWVLRAGVSDRQWATIEIGDRATVVTDAYPDIKMQGTVTSKSEGLDPSSGTFNLNISIDNKYKNKLAAGLFGTATIVCSKPQSVWSIPYNALLDAEKDTGYVFVATDDHKAHKVKVVIERLSHPNVIISSGLENYNRIILEGNAYLKEGSMIKLTE
ncbi:MAG: efflux RND transporter periplasmic adaptor subunit [Saprospiraceae bacterium]|nr:efflux RND transporter periplasmic adaptor subunit [Saprospiraceae bacterium]